MRQKLLEPFPFSGVHLSKSQVSKEAVWTWRWRGHGRSGHIPDLTQHGQDPPRENGRDWERLRDVMAPPGNRMHPQGGRAGLLHAVQETTGGHPQHCPHTPPKETQPEQHLGGQWRQGPGNPDQVSANRSLCGPREPMAPQRQTEGDHQSRLS